MEGGWKNSLLLRHHIFIRCNSLFNSPNCFRSLCMFVHNTVIFIAPFLGPTGGSIGCCNDFRLNDVLDFGDCFISLRMMIHHSIIVPFLHPWWGCIGCLCEGLHVHGKIEGEIIEIRPNGFGFTITRTSQTRTLWKSQHWEVKKDRDKPKEPNAMNKVVGKSRTHS